MYFNEVRSVRCYQLSLQSSSFQRYIISCEFVGNFSLELVDRQLLTGCTLVGDRVSDKNITNLIAIQRIIQNS